MVGLKFTVIGPKNLPRMFDPTTVIDRMTKVVREEADINERSFNRFTKTWKNATVFENDVDHLDDEITGTVKSSSTPFVFVEGGTKSRPKSRITKFKPKTRPRVIGSGRGVRGALYATRKMTKKGIAPREIRIEIAERRERPFAKKVGRQIKIGLRAALKKAG